VNLSKTGSIDKSVLEAASSNTFVLTSNEAFRNLLPDMCLTDAKPNLLAQDIKNAARINRSIELRDFVIANHSLGGLVNRVDSLL
jgi:hypothetical protein